MQLVGVILQGNQYGMRPEQRSVLAPAPSFFFILAGMPGFVRVVGPRELAFPDYDGNGMFKSLGNIEVNPNIGLLFIAMHDKPRRLRVNGTATVSRNDPLLARPGARPDRRWPGAQPGRGQER